MEFLPAHLTVEVLCTAVEPQLCYPASKQKDLHVSDQATACASKGLSRSPVFNVTKEESLPREGESTVQKDGIPPW